jgi:hypothetical protein
MKNLKLLNRYFLIILISLFFSFVGQSEEPVDIWSIDKKKIIKEIEATEAEDLELKDKSQNSIYNMQTDKLDVIDIDEDETLTSKKVNIVGLYDPAANGLDINMWSNSNGKTILSLLEDLNKVELSNDASEILNIVLLTNAFYPQLNISKEQFLKMKSNWLIKKSNFKVIEEYLLNNQIINENPKLTKYLVNHYLSNSEIEKACDIFEKIENPIQDEYLSKFNIYCLINNNKKEEAQLLIDLKKELGFSDKFYEKKIGYLMGYDKPDTEISEKTILDFHLSHRTNSKFKFEPRDSTSKQIWKYLSSSNLLDNIQDVELSNFEKISTIEKATHEKNYTEKELFELYKRFQFNINQLLNIKDSSKVLSAIETRALIYQGILITTEVELKLQLMNALKNSFKNDGIENAFNQELTKFLLEINPEEVPSNYTAFYKKYINKDEKKFTNIKINNKILHQSKLVNYFKEENQAKDVSKDLNDLLKKIKKNKKYFFSKKDVILVEALKSDGIKVSDKYKNLYKINDSEMPTDIQILIDNKDMGVAMLRIVEVIGQDELRDIDADTMYFIINTLNLLDVDPIRNKILLKVLPLKV